MNLVYSGPDIQGIAFVASEFVVVSLAFSLNSSKFRGENKQQPVAPCSLIVYSLRIIEVALFRDLVYRHTFNSPYQWRRNGGRGGTPPQY